MPATPASAPPPTVAPAHPAVSPLNIFDHRWRRVHEGQRKVYRQRTAILAKQTRAVPGEAASRNLRTGFVPAIIFDSPKKLFKPSSSGFMEYVSSQEAHCGPIGTVRRIRHGSMKSGRALTCRQRAYRIPDVPAKRLRTL